MIYNNKNVRRQDRLLEEKDAAELLQTGEYGFLSLVETGENGPGGYGVPLNYVWDGKNAIYFHCAPEGHKLNCLILNPRVSFCIVGQTKVISDKYTTAYESIIIRGKINPDLPDEERMSALLMILDKYSPQDKEIGIKYAQKSFHRTTILRLDMEEISGKTKRIK
jgi:Predicted flavin-nucleotide-binding protein